MASVLLWVTDPHFNVADPTAFGTRIHTAIREATDHTVTGLVVTGDISEGHTVATHLQALQNAVGLPVYFVLGNHDLYHAKAARVYASVRALAPACVWLREHPPIPLSLTTVLTGHDGWYDARSGNPHNTMVVLNDFTHIHDLKKVAVVHPHFGLLNRVELIAVLRARADAWAQEALEKLRVALTSRPERVIFATHVPPFPGSCWHRGAPSDGQWQPWFVNTALGNVLAEVAEANPTVQFEVLCGHTHSPGVYTHSSNLVVRTGESAYHHPQISGIIEIGR